MADTSFLDWPFLDDHHRTLARDLEAWCIAEQLADRHSDEDIDGQCRALVRLLGAGGWLRYCVPAPWGLLDTLDVRSLSLIRETLARHNGLADFVFAMQGLGSGTISLFGSASQRAAYLPGVADGSRIAAFALTELDSGSDVAAMTTSAKRSGNGWAIDGAKTYISNGGIADHYVLFARTGEAPGAKGISAFVVDAETPGLSIAERIQVTAPHPLATIQFDSMQLPTEALIGEVGRGFVQAMATLDVFRTTVGAAALGFARRALDEALTRVQRPRAGGGTLADFQMVQGHLADMALQIDAAALLIYRAAWVKDSGAARVSREAAMAKLYATEAAQKIIDMALQLHGGDGVRQGFAVESLYREIRALRIYEGASDVQRVVIARSILG